MTVKSIDDARKQKEERCMFCGAKPACFAWTCPRLSEVTVDDQGWTVKFKDDPPEDEE